jgi:hypothetical protein
MGLRDEQGMMAIGVALMLIVVLALFGGTLWQYSMAELKRVERTEQDIQALFLARAGAEIVMAAWLEESVGEKPAGVMERIYYNRDSGHFQLTEPSDYLGYVDVVVSIIDDPQDSLRDGLTQIVATSVVDGVSRTATATTYPHLFGHDPSLAWYSERYGTIQMSNAFAEEPVIMRTDNRASNNPLHVDNTLPGESEVVTVQFEAPAIVFESPMILGHNIGSGRNGRVNVVVCAETIFFDEVIVSNLPSSKPFIITYPDRIYSVILKVPDGMGILGFEIGAEDPTAKYGTVYFDHGTVSKQNYSWGFLGGISKKVLEVLKVKNTSKNLAKGAFYFKDDTDLSNLAADSLIPIPDSESRSNPFKGTGTFVWE